MSNLGSVAVFDLTKLGTAYQIINAFVDDKVVHAFEVSPIGTQAVLILSSKDSIALKLIYEQCLRFYRSDILQSELIAEINNEVIAAYLSQNKTQILKHMLVVEGESFAKGFATAELLLKNGLHIVDFRAVRTSPPNIAITATSSSVETLINMTEFCKNAKTTLVENVQSALRTYFEI